MGNRTKKAKKRKGRARSDAGLEAIDDQGRGEALQEVDMEWLADEYRRRSSSESSLTLRIFSDQYGISPDELCTYLPELGNISDNPITLWHGTTRSRAKSILREGFDGRRAPIYFAANTRLPRHVATGRAGREGDEPVVIVCSIDLGRYSQYDYRKGGIYVFKHKHIGSEVVEEVVSAYSKKIGKKTQSVELTNVAIAFNSGRVGIALWINSYLKLSGADRISEDHEAVVKIKEWLDAQADAGRFGEVSDEEMLIQVREHLPQYSG